MRKSLKLLLAMSLVTTPLVSAQAFDLEQSLRELAVGHESPAGFDLHVAQSGGKSLSEAIDDVRRKTNGRIVSAETRTNGNREVHYIKVLTKDGKVKTHKVPGRKLRDR